jgi:hypothetical protein
MKVDIEAIMKTQRHDFWIQPLGKQPGLFRPQRYLYQCLRCSWAFMVNDAGRGIITALDSDSDQLHPEEALRRLRTFEQGPCPSLMAMDEFDAGRERDEPAAAPIRVAVRPNRVGSRGASRADLWLVPPRRPQLEPTR